MFPLHSSIEVISDRGDGRLNEDSFLIQDDFFAVFDGATSISKNLVNGNLTGGFLASRIARDSFSNDLSTNKEISLLDLILNANLKIKEAMEKHKIDYTNPRDYWSTVLSCVRISDEFLEYAFVGDCTIYIITKDGKIEQLSKDQLEHIDKKTIEKATALRSEKGIFMSCKN